MSPVEVKLCSSGISIVWKSHLSRAMPLTASHKTKRQAAQSRPRSKACLREAKQSETELAQTHLLRTLPKVMQTKHMMSRRFSKRTRMTTLETSRVFRTSLKQINQWNSKKNRQIRKMLIRHKTKSAKFLWSDLIMSIFLKNTLVTN